MKTAASTQRKIGRTWLNILAALALLALAFPVTTVARAEAASPFVGAWRATDVDGSDIRLAIGGRPAGPFQITWTESYIGFCNREAGIVRGTGLLDVNDPNLLHGDLLVECFTTGATLDLDLTWTYHANSNALSSSYGNGVMTIWTRPGEAGPEPPALGLRVNYGFDDWVESFYEGGHTAWVTVADSSGATIATTQLITEPKWYWGGATGFTSLDGTWLDANGNSMETAPDIRPNDWVYGWMDNGASAQVQVGDISGMIDLSNATVSGTISAPWFGQEVTVECMDWGSSGTPFPNKDGGSILPDGDDAYSCSWAGEWEMQPEPTVGVAYTGPDGNWVANAFGGASPHFFASAVGDWLWTTNFARNTVLTVSIFQSSVPGATLLWTGYPATDDSGFVVVNSSKHGLDLVPGNYITVSDGDVTKSLVLEPIEVDVFDTINDFMAGTAPAGSSVWVAAGPQAWQKGMFVMADPITGAWAADFKTIPFDITEDMRGWSYAQLYDPDGDVNEADPPALGSVIWAATFTLDAALWSPGLHTYYFENTYLVPAPTSVTTGPVLFMAVESLPLYDGYVMLRPGAPRALADGGCPPIPAGPAGIPPNISTSQPTRFVYGWVTDSPMTYEEALAHFGSMTVKAYWDGGDGFELDRQEIVPYSADEWPQYVCSFAD